MTCLSVRIASWKKRWQQRGITRSEWLELGRKSPGSLPEHLFRDADFVLALCSKTHRAYYRVHEDLKRDKRFMLLLLSNQGGNINSSFIQRIADSLKDDKEVMLAAVGNCGHYLRHASERLRNDFDVVIAAIQNDGSALEHASQHLQADPEIVHAAVLCRAERYGGRAYCRRHALMYASQDLQQDKGLVTLAIENGLPFWEVCDELKADREIALLATKHNNRFVLHHATPQLCADRELVQTAVRLCGTQLRFASLELRDDPEIVMAAVRQCGVALEHASTRLRAERDIVLAALSESGLALRFCAPSLRSDSEVVRRAVHTDGMALEFASEGLRRDPNTVLAAVTNNGRALEFASRAFRSDREITLTALQHLKKLWPDALRHLSEELRGDFKVAMAAVAMDRNNFQYASKDLQNTPQFVASALMTGNFKHCRYEIAKWCGSELFEKLQSVTRMLFRESRKWEKPDRAVALRVRRYDGKQVLMHPTLSTLPDDLRRELVGEDLDRLVTFRLSKFERREQMLRPVFSTLPDDIGGVVKSFLGDDIDGLLKDCLPVIRAYENQFGGRSNSWAILGNGGSLHCGGLA